MLRGGDDRALNQVLGQGTVVRVMGLDEMYPNFAVSVAGFSPDFYANRAVAQAFVRAYIRGIRRRYSVRRSMAPRSAGSRRFITRAAASDQTM